VSDKVAESICTKVEALIAANASGQPIDPETAAWLGRISSELHGRLEQLGLVQARGDRPNAASLKSVLDAYISGRAKLKPNTLRNYKTSRRLLEEHFGKDRPLGSIHAGHARDYREWLVGKYATATVSREIKRARQFWEYAKDCRLTAENPFAKVKAGSQTNSSRKHFVSLETIAVAIEACPDAEWRLIVAMARYGGLRMPSELVGLTWDRIDWVNGWFTVDVPKKEHLDGQALRRVPIFPELRPYLEQAFDAAPEGSVYVAPRCRDGKTNLRTGLERILRKAGVAQWPKLFQNLRASRETELMKKYPAHVVHAWLGNSREVAEDHYLMVTDEDYRRAASSAATDPLSEAVQKAVQSAALSGSQPSSPEKESAVSPAVADYTADQIPPRGVEPTWDFTGDSKSSARGGAKSGAVAIDASLLDALRLLARMTDAERQALLEALGAVLRPAE
jgi:integrase